MAWIHNGRKYWYHNGKRYSKNIRKKRYKNNNNYFWIDGGGNHRSTDYQGYMKARASGHKVYTNNSNIIISDSVKSSNYVDPDIWNF